MLGGIGAQHAEVGSSVGHSSAGLQNAVIQVQLYYWSGLEGTLLYAYNHPEVDRIWGIYGEYILVLSKIIFYLFKDGCRLIGMSMRNARLCRLTMHID